MTAPTVPPARRNPADPGQREAARDHVTQLRQDGGTYRSIAAAAAVSPATLRALTAGRRRAQPGTATAVLKVTRRSAAAPTAGRGRNPAAAPGPARHGPRLGPHRPRHRRQPQDHPQARPRRRPHRQPAPARRRRRPLRRVVGQAPPSPHPLRARRGRPPPAAAPSPATGAPPPPWTTTCSTPPATARGRAGNPPPAPASPPTSTRRHDTARPRRTHARRRTLDLGLHFRPAATASGPGTACGTCCAPPPCSLGSSTSPTSPPWPGTPTSAPPSTCTSAPPPASSTAPAQPPHNTSARELTPTCYASPAMKRGVLFEHG